MVNHTFTLTIQSISLFRPIVDCCLYTLVVPLYFIFFILIITRIKKYNNIYNFKLTCVCVCACVRTRKLKHYGKD